MAPVRKATLPAQPTLPRVTQHETLHTINVVLQQAALAHLSLSVRRRHVSCRYVQILAKKATLRLDTSIKRSICSNCHSLLLPGISSATRIKPFKACDLVVRTRCLTCQARKRLPCLPNVRYRVKVAARKRRKRAKHVEEQSMRKKMEKIPAASMENAGASRRTLLLNSSGRLSQRARRRESARKSSALYGTYSRPIKRRRRVQRSAKLDPDLLPTEEEPEVVGELAKANDRRAKRRRGRKRTAGERLVGMVSFTDRTMGEDEMNWTKKIPAHVTQAQKSALTTLRGNHFFTVGLGKGGAVGHLEG